MSTEQSNDRKLVTVTLPARYWITVLALLDVALRNTALPQLEELKKRGARIEDLPDAQKAALSGPIFARAEIVKSLHVAGIMTAEANLQHGTDGLMALVNRLKNQADEDRK